MNASSPGTFSGSFSEAQLRQMLGSPAGRELLQLLTQDGGATMRQAAAAVRAGNQQRAQELLRPLLETPQAQALLRQLHG